METGTERGIRAVEEAGEAVKDRIETTGGKAT
jgi:hypothetical protein